MKLDWSILQGIQSLTNPVLDYVMPKITTLGNGGAIWLVSNGTLLATKKYRRWGVLVLSGLAALIAFSRLYLYVHFPPDVLGAAAMRIVVGLAVCAAGKWLLPLSIR